MACVKLFQHSSAHHNRYDLVILIKMTDIISEMTVGHLPTENYRATKFLLYREATVFAVLSSFVC